MGAKFMDSVAVLHASCRVCKNWFLKPSHSSTDLHTWIAPYTTKYWHERIITHCTAGETGGITSPGHVPLGGSKLMMPYTTTRAPAYRPSMMRNLSAVKHPATILFEKGFASLGMSPVLTSTAITLPVKIGMTHTTSVIASTA